MDNLKEPLALGFELSSFILISYGVHEWVATQLGYSENITLAGLLSFSLILWTTHAYFYVEKRK